MALHCVRWKVLRNAGHQFLLNAFQPRVNIPLRLTVAYICSKDFKDPSYKKPAPWPYKEKKFTFLHGFIDNTMDRFDENTKVLIVDGNIAAGKTTLAEQLAKELDMLYVPEANLDMIYITPYGYDLRQLDSVVPHSYQSCDINTYYSNPHHHNVPALQLKMFTLRFKQYIDALAHVLSTGQGVVMDRSVYSDFVFLETMHKMGYLSDQVRKYYYKVSQNGIEELLKPHLIIYLDVSVDVVKERIKKRNRPHEVDSKVLSTEYLESLEYFYKQKFLKEISTHAEILIYDWNNFGDVEVVVDDIERTDFDRFERYDAKMKDWRIDDKWRWNMLRRKYTNEIGYLMQFIRSYEPEIEELYHPADEALEYRELIKKVPGERYEKGFNADAGDKGVLFKLTESYRDPVTYR